jgi:murein tripeptide amidase MpaA
LKNIARNHTYGKRLAQTIVKNIVLLVGRKKNVNYGVKTKENIEMSKFRESLKPL